MHGDQYKKHTVQEIRENLPINLNKECLQAYAKDLCKAEPWNYSGAGGENVAGELPETIYTAMQCEPDQMKKPALKVVHNAVIVIYAEQRNKHLRNAAPHKELQPG